MIALFARPVVDLNLRGKHIAYHRSIDINVRVNMLTVTDTVCNKDQAEADLFFKYLYDRR